MTPLLEARNISRVLAGDPPVMLVSDVSLAFLPGKFTAILGPSGCGKSSLLYLLGLLDRASAGQVFIEGADVSELDGDARARLRLEKFGFVFQFHFLLPEFGAAENVMLPMLRLGAMERKAAEEHAQQLLALMGMAEKASKTPERLSGGERQRVAIARALANNPSLILGDEPTGNLDSQNSARVIEIFRMLAREQQRTVICVTHDLAVAAAADIRIDMLDGRIVNVSEQAE